MSGKIWQNCPNFYECAKIQMTPMIRALRHCSADEAMQSICANCAEKPLLQEIPDRESYVDARTR